MSKHMWSLLRALTLKQKALPWTEVPSCYSQEGLSTTGTTPRLEQQAQEQAPPVTEVTSPGVRSGGPGSVNMYLHTDVFRGRSERMFVKMLIRILALDERIPRDIYYTFVLFCTV